MQLSKLIKNIKYLELVNYKNVKINSISMHHTNCTKSSLFFAIDGFNTSGRMYAQDAVQNGAVAIVCSKKIDVDNVIQIIVDDVRSCMSIIANTFYGCPQKRIKIIAVIGSNGKTTTANILYNILKFCGKKVGLIGTLGVKINDISLPSELTTPDPIELNYYMQQMVNFGCEYCVMELSAHAIALNKMYGIKVFCGIFTNISNEHLDFFKNMQNYAMTKVGYFNPSNMNYAIVNVDDKYGKLIALDSNLKVFTYGLYNPADIFAINIKYNLKKCSFIVNSNDKIAKVVSSFVGEYNVYNVLGAISCAELIGCEFDSIVLALSSIKNISGRMEVFDFTKDKKVVVDFAHTPDGFEKVLSLVRKVRNGGRIITLFGSVGYADSAKRKLMGQIALKYSDIVILTSDNPGKMGFDAVCDDIGIFGDNVVRIEDRIKAIEYGVGIMQEHDTLVCLGKGGETKQVVNNAVLPYNEVDVVKSAIRRAKG